MDNKFFLFLLLAFVVSCSKTTENTVYKIINSDSQKSESSSSAGLNSSFKSWLKLSDDSTANLAFAELLLRAVKKENETEVKQFVEDLSPEEIESIVRDAQKSYQYEKIQLLYHDTWSYDLERNSIYWDIDNPALDSENFQNQLILKTFSYIKSKSLNSIFKAYGDSIAEVSRPVAIEAIKSIAESEPMAADKIERAILAGKTKEEVVQLIKNVGSYSKKVTALMGELNQDEQVFAAVNIAVAGVVYFEIKDKKSFKDAVAFYQNVKAEIEKLKLAIKQVQALGKGVEDFKTIAEKSLKDFQTGMNGIHDDIVTQAKKVKETHSTLGQNPINAAKVYRGIRSSLLGKNNSDQGIDITVEPINTKNFELCVNAVGTSAQALDTLLSSVAETAKKLGVKLPKDVSKVIEKSRTVVQIAGVAQKVFSGFSSGGLLGGFSALGSGILGAQDPVMAQLGALDGKIELILEQQKEIIDLQKKTMGMIKDLSVMVDEYHQQTMAALSEIRDTQLVQLEMDKASLNSSIGSCEAMWNYYNSSVWNTKRSFYSAPFLNINLAQLYESFVSLPALKKFVKSAGENDFSDCQSAFSRAFGGRPAEENPLRLIFSSNEGSRLYRFEKYTYRPLLGLLKNQTENSDVSKYILQVPVSTFQGLEFKKGIVLKNNQTSIYDLENLYSEKALERYSYQLITLFPFLDLDRQEWMQDLNGIISAYFQNLDYTSIEQNFTYRSHFFLQNALGVTQSVIAQEALLAGEPLLEILLNRKNEIFGGAECLRFESAEGNENALLLSSVRSNRLLMRNLLSFSLYKQLKVQPQNFTVNEYELAYKNNDFLSLARFLGMGVDASRLAYESDGVYLKVLSPERTGDKPIELKVRLPAPDSLRKGLIYYSENMHRALIIQNNITDAIIKTSRKKQAREFASLMLLNAI